MRAFAVFGCALFGLAFFAGLATAQEFEVVSVKPNTSDSHRSSTNSDRGRLTATNVTLRDLVVMASGLKDYQVETPDWLRDAHFDLAAKFPEELPANSEKYDAAVEAMMQKMLTQRFKMVAHRSSKTFSVYALVIAGKGIKFKQAPDCDSHNSRSNKTHYAGTCVSMAGFADFLARRAELPVLDMTGLKGYYDLKLDWDPPPKADSPDLPAGVSLPIALQEQLGLKLDARKAPIETLVVDRIEKLPTEN